MNFDPGERRPLSTRESEARDIRIFSASSACVIPASSIVSRRRLGEKLYTRITPRCLRVTIIGYCWRCDVSTDFTHKLIYRIAHAWACAQSGSFMLWLLIEVTVAKWQPPM